MPRISKPDTHTGDDGTTSTIQGKRVYKDAPLIKAFGTLDELNSAIGLILTCRDLPVSFTSILRSTQNTLFHLGSDLDLNQEINDTHLQPHIEDKHVTELNNLISKIYSEVGPLKNFTHPGGSESAAKLHMARAICRRAERDVITLSHIVKIGALTIKYLNRLSDTLFLMARSENKREGYQEKIWNSHD
jgi:cob(I)alamin adenosyltransferase|tara:strand:+ start:144 stop:710 length:567 start_codon:yes stop_codon:yes gene_type:complete